MIYVEQLATEVKGWEQVLGSGQVPGKPDAGGNEAQPGEQEVADQTYLIRPEKMGEDQV